MSGKMLFIVFVLAFSFCCIASAQKIVTDGLVSYWTLDQSDIQGNTVKDVWGSNHGEIVGKAKTVEGKIEEGMEFDGGSSFVDCGTDDSLDLPNALTIELWMKPNSAGEGGPNAGPACKADAAVSPWCWQLRYNAPGSFMGFQFNADPGGSTWISVQENLKPDEWYHITGTFDGKDIVCYLNAVEKQRGSIAAIASGAGRFYIGQDGWVNVFDGVVDEVRMYNRALTESEIQHNFRTVSQLSVESIGKAATLWGWIKTDPTKVGTPD